MRALSMTFVVWATATQLALAEDAQTCHPEQLPTLGGPDTYAYDINDKGEIAGTSVFVDADGQRRGEHAFVWKRGQLQALENFPDSTISVAVGLNEAGTIVGTALPRGVPNPLPVAWVHGELVSLRLLPGANGGGASAVNNRGQIVGSVQTVGETVGDPHCVLWPHPRAAPVDLNVTGFCNASAINEQGVIVGTTTRPDGQFLAFRWRNGSVTYLPVPPSVTFSGSSDVNANGTIVGSTSDTPGVSYAAVWEPNLELTTFSNLPGAAQSINDRGDVAVAVRPESGDGRLAWIDRDAVVHDLVPAGGAALGFVIDFGINNRRQAFWTAATDDGVHAFTCRVGH